MYIAKILNKRFALLDIIKIYDIIFVSEIRKFDFNKKYDVRIYVNINNYYIFFGNSHISKQIYGNMCSPKWIAYK